MNLLNLLTNEEIDAEIFTLGSTLVVRNLKDPEDTYVGTYRSLKDFQKEWADAITIITEEERRILVDWLKLMSIAGDNSTKYISYDGKFLSAKDDSKSTVDRIVPLSNTFKNFPNNIDFSIEKLGIANRIRKN